MICGACGSSDNPFFCKDSITCLLCEQNTLKKCNCCHRMMPMTRFASHKTRADRRESRCLPCKRKGSVAQKLCESCGNPMESERGNRRYHDYCKKPKSHKPQKNRFENSLMAAFVAGKKI